MQLTNIVKRLQKKLITHNVIEVSKSRLLHNYDYFKNGSKLNVIPVLKANAYGHGIQVVATALKDRKPPYIAVDGYFEALHVREVSKQPVLIMGAINVVNFKYIKYDNFAFVVQDVETIRALGAINKKINIHLEINTGMNRYGAEPDEVIELVNLIQSYPKLKLEGIMSHLASSDEDNTASIDEATKVFDTCVKVCIDAGARPSLVHISQTAASMRVRSKYANAIRLGIGLYGINPFAKNHKLHSPLQKDLRPALTVKSTITRVHSLNRGDKVSYNYTFTATKKMRVGVLPFGYYEGLDRRLSNAGKVKIGGQYSRIIGRVCMNHAMIDLTGTDIQVNDQVIIYSNKPTDKNSIDQIANDYGLFNYSLLTSLSADTRRVLVD